MHNKLYLRPVLLGLITLLFAISCDKDYDGLGTDIVGDDHFSGYDPYTGATVKAYNQGLGAVSSNNLPVNPLGFYENPAFGNTQANFVTQVEMATSSPIFNNTDADLYQVLPVIDSVILNIPYFSHVPSDAEIVDGVTPYELDSIYGVNESKFKLSIYQSNYFLRDLDPDQGLGEQQMFYTDKDQEIDNNKVPILLNNDANPRENAEFFFDKRQHKTMVLNDDNEPVYTRTAPSMRLHLSKSFFDNLILNAPSGQLANNAVFKNYFRGLYFKTESIGNPGNMAMINFKGGTITIYYQEDKKTTTNGTTTFPRVKKTYVLNLTGNTVSLLNNSNENSAYSNAINPTNATQEAEKLYVKGGAGSVAIVDLFGTADGYKYVIKKDGSGNTVTDADGDPLYVKELTPNNVSDELDDLRYPPVPGAPGDYSKKERWMINEANLTFYIDKTAMTNASEPDRIYIYDLKNRKILVDYSSDFSTNSLYPKFNKYVFGGIIRKEDNGRGVKYKIRITNHLRNLIKNDSTNIRLGLSVTENINNIAFSKRKTPGTDAVKHVPSMSVMNPLGTILYGTNIPFGSADYDKRLKLEIYYTKPD